MLLNFRPTSLIHKSEDVYDEGTMTKSITQKRLCLLMVVRSTLCLVRRSGEFLLQFVRG